MTKAQLETENKNLKKELAGFEKRLEDAIKKQLEDVCDEGRERIENFCTDLGLEVPKQILKIEIPYGLKIYEIYDDEQEEVSFRILD
jgi:hypothetical protein